MLASLSFPELSPWALRFDTATIGLDYGAFGLRWYGLAYVCGLVLGWAYTVQLVKRCALWPQSTPPMKAAEIERLVTILILGIIIGGRLGFVLFYKPEYFAENPAQIIAVWQGGMSFHGGLLGVGAALIFLSRIHKIPLVSLADMIACAAPIGLFFGRIANFINAELYGRFWEGPWAIVFPQHWSNETQQWIYGDLASAGARHPSQLYEAGLEGIILFCILLGCALRGALRRPGLCTGIFLMLYGVFRIFIELFREPDAFLHTQRFLQWQITQGQLLSLPMVLAGAGFIVYALNAKRPPPHQGRITHA